MNLQNYFKEKILNIQNKDNLIKVVNAIQKSSIEIKNKLAYAAILSINGSVTNINSSGDEQKKLDVISNDIMIHELKFTDCCSILISEEDEKPTIVKTKSKNNFVVAFDPLDGSSNIDCNCCVGTIFSIYEDNINQERILRNGNDMICAGYILYGPSTELVVAFGKNNGVQRFILDKYNEYIYVGNISMNNKNLQSSIYSINESNSQNWYDDVKMLIESYKVKNTKYTARYVGSMVADVHRTLMYGGMFAYPADMKNKDGKLRVLYECFPMARIIEEAGGRAIVGKKSILRVLDIIVEKIHQRSSIIIGTKEEIDKYESIYKTMIKSKL
jgi:fructose-1,6-bisphosphatase I